MRKQAVCASFVACAALHTVALCVVMLLIGSALVHRYKIVNDQFDDDAVPSKSLRMPWMHFRL